MPHRFRYSILLWASIVAAAPQTLLENEQVRVLKAVDQPHAKGAPHEHKVNRVMVYLNPGKQEFVSNGKASTLQYKAGDVLWSPAAGTHTSEVVSDVPVTMVEVEVKNTGAAKKTPDTALDPLKVDRKHYHLEFENPQVRVFRVRFGPQESAPLHEHVLNRVVVYLTDQNTLMTADGKTETAQHKAGEASWGGAVKHTERNQMDKPFEAVVVELKN
jgi:phage host-nuclease inhibitor protein Gam